MTINYGHSYATQHLETMSYYVYGYADHIHLHKLDTKHGTGELGSCNCNIES